MALLRLQDVRADWFSWERLLGINPGVCGEHDSRTPSPSRSRGSSPRVRGTRTSPGKHPIGARIIPACAGNTQPQHAAQPSSSDHPRVCGEHHNRLVESVPIRGSSPRVRGTLQSTTRLWRSSRIIPACAGNTSEVPTHTLPHSDHPRVCGEHLEPVVARWNVGGSSPRVRGTRRKLCCSRSA